MNWFLYLFFGLFYVVGFGVLGGGIWGAYASSLAGSWPTTPGTIRRLELKEQRGGEDETAIVEVEYSYAVNGVDYEGSRLAYGYCGSNLFAEHEQIYQKLKGASSVDVRYDPADPSASCLSHGIHSSILFLIAFGLTWNAFIFGCTMTVWLVSASESVLTNNLVTK